ncbi:MAG: exodeoxyribonuclease VII small subunit [Ignavibacteriaceae bacterium]|jgi:exodeoxyribonuclease VII small subunit|nr:exodeoxyribonuclease VII small subunit [Ignavibacteriaceae bacterium]
MSKKIIKNNFESKLTRLEEISEKLESENIGLETSIELYEEGVKLSMECITALKNAELKITELKIKLDEFSRNVNR